MKSRVVAFHNFTAKEENGSLRQGHEYRVLYNLYGYNEIGVILRWKDGKLNDDGELPAVEFADCHFEHFSNGVLHNEGRDINDALKPAIITFDEKHNKEIEYFINGKQVDKNNKVVA